MNKPELSEDEMLALAIIFKDKCIDFGLSNDQCNILARIGNLISNAAYNEGYNKGFSDGQFDI